MIPSWLLARIVVVIWWVSLWTFLAVVVAAIWALVRQYQKDKYIQACMNCGGTPYTCSCNHYDEP